MATKLRDAPLPDYETDVAGWAEGQAAALRERRIDALDWDNLAEEIADVSGRERDKIESAMVMLIAHLLKWDHQQSRRSLSWFLTVNEQRRRILRGFRDNPSMRPRASELTLDSYGGGRNEAARQMRILPKLLPADCPYSFDEIMTRPVEWDGEAA